MIGSLNQSISFPLITMELQSGYLKWILLLETEMLDKFSIVPTMPKIKDLICSNVDFPPPA